MTNTFEGKPDGRQSADVGHKVSRFRPTYRALTDVEKALHDEIKTKASELEALIEKVGDTKSRVSMPPTVGRYCALAITDLEKSVMWVIKGLTA